METLLVFTLFAFLGCGREDTTLQGEYLQSGYLESYKKEYDDYYKEKYKEYCIATNENGRCTIYNFKAIYEDMVLGYRIKR